MIDMMNQAVQEIYKKNATNTAAPEDLTLMLYNGCLKFIKLTKQGIEEKDIQKKHTNCVKAQNIIREFMVTLNMDIEISKNYMQLYDYIHRLLVEANTKSNLDALNEAEEMVTELRDTWKQAMTIYKQQKHK